jgi:hypothetical protein
MLSTNATDTQAKQTAAASTQVVSVPRPWTSRLGGDEPATSVFLTTTTRLVSLGSPSSSLTERQAVPGLVTSEYIPKCTWIDADHTNDIAIASLKFDVSAYGENVQDTVGNDACAATLYGPDSGPIAGKFSRCEF